MKKILLDFGNSNHLTISRLVAGWEIEKITSQNLQAWALIALLMVSLVPFDLLFFGQSAIIYLPYRVSVAILAVILFKISPKINVYSNSKYFHKIRFIEACFAISTIVGLYYFFYSIAPDEHRKIVESAIYMVTLIGYFYYGHFWKISTLIIAVSALTTMTIALSLPEHRNTFLSFSLWHVGIYYVIWFQRRQFAYALFTRYQQLLYQLPPNIAEILTITEQSLDLNQTYRPAKKPCICIVMDWRDFQKMTSKFSPDFIARILEQGHDLTLEQLRASIKEGSYSVDWSADELFITITPETDQAIDVLVPNLMQLLDCLQKDLPGIFRSHMDIEPKFDIGCAMSVALHGLMGPQNMKKMTTLGEVGGIAKRLETEAKDSRKRAQAPSDLPNLAINANLYELIQRVAPEQAQQFIQTQSQVKNLENQLVYIRQGQAAIKLVA